MAVTVPPTVLRRRAGIAAGAALLTLTVTGCSGLGRTAVGPVSYSVEKDQAKVVTVHSPSVKGCHTMDPAGAGKIDNRTLVDLVLYTTKDCTGRASAYVATTFSDTNAARALPWRSYRFVH
uniref:Lipoprotein n=1 Tax=Streptomyces sp. NBC_01401 TaxID=2903854 RepID=A0AAU3H2Z5_9ACTN